jgi:DNA-binding SARP family transcriptional activator
MWEYLFCKGFHGEAAHQKGYQAVGPPDPGQIRPRLLGSFELLVEEKPTPLLAPSQRLTALLGVEHDRWIRRTYAAGILWPEVNEDTARSNLRSALWRLGPVRDSLVESTGDELRLRPGVRVDLYERRAQARVLLEPTGDGANPSPALFADDLLPDWSEMWVEPGRESYRQLRLHTLEALSNRLMTEGRFGEAVEAGFMAVAADPLRESAHLAVIRAMLMEGNRAKALCHHRQLVDLLQHELGVEPTFRLEDVLGEFEGSPPRPPIPQRPGNATATRRKRPGHPSPGR